MNAADAEAVILPASAVPDEDDSGVAGTQRFLYHREYLFAFGLRFQGFFSRSNAERAWNGFKSGK